MTAPDSCHGDRTANEPIAAETGGFPDGSGPEQARGARAEDEDESYDQPVRVTRRTAFGRFRLRLRALYHGHNESSRRFQAVILLVDLTIIAFFVVSPVLRGTNYFLVVDYTIAAILAIDLIARALATRNLKRWVRQPFVILDLIILATLLLPQLFVSFAFLRIVRLWSLSRSGVLWAELRRSRYAKYEIGLRAGVNLVTFLFLATGFIYTFFFRQSSGLEGYINALYFTVASVTTTGYGDITLNGPLGKLTAITIMIIGISLFFNLAQAIFKPAKVHHECSECGLQRHDPDAVHCKACGHQLKIPNDEG